MGGRRMLKSQRSAHQIGNNFLAWPVLPLSSIETQVIFLQLLLPSCLPPEQQWLSREESMKMVICQKGEGMLRPLRIAPLKLQGKRDSKKLLISGVIASLS